MNRAARFAYRFVGPLVFVALVWRTDRSDVEEVWRRGVPALLWGAAGLNVVIILVKAWRWRHLMMMQRILYGYAPAVRYYAIGSAMAAWTPGRLGDFTKAIAVHRDRKVGLGRAASSVIADRLMDALAMAAVASAGAAALPGRHGAVRASLVSVGVVVAMVVGWIATRRPGGRMLRGGAELLMSPFSSARDGAGALLGGMKDLARPALVIPAGVTVAATAVTFLQGYLVACGLGLHVGFGTLSVALAAVSITSLLPVSVGGIGTREATLAVFLGPGGTGMAEIIGFSVATLLVINGSTAVLGAAAWMSRPSPSENVTA